MESITIVSKQLHSSGYHKSVCSIKITFECIENDSNNQVEYEDACCVLHRVQIIPTTATDFMIDCPLDDDEVRKHFEQLLSDNWHGYPVHTAMEVIWKT